MLERRFDHRHALSLDGHVGALRKASSPEPFDFFGDVSKVALRSRANGKVRALGRVCERYCPSDSFSSASHQGYPVL